MGVTTQELLKKFPQVIENVKGENQSITHLATLETANKGSIVFLQTESEFASSLASKASVIAGPTKLVEKYSSQSQNTFLSLKVPNHMALAYISQIYFAIDPRDPYKPQIHPNANIADSAEIDGSAFVMSGAVIEEGVKIGKNVFVGTNTFIGRNSVLQENTTLYPNVYIADHTEIGKKCIVQSNTSIGSIGYGYAQDSNFNHHTIPQIGKVVIEDEVHIGANCAIDRATIHETRIGSGTKIDNLCHIAHNCIIGKNCLLTAGFVIAGSSKVGDRVVAGGQTGVTDHVSITSDVHLAARSAVAKSIDKPGAYGGLPLQPLNDYLKTKAVIAQLPKMRKQLSKLIKKMGIE